MCIDAVRNALLEWNVIAATWFHHRHSLLSMPQAVQLACEELRKSLDKVAAEESRDLTWKELVAAAGNPAGFAPSKVCGPQYARAQDNRLSF